MGRRYRARSRGMTWKKGQQVIAVLVERNEQQSVLTAPKRLGNVIDHRVHAQAAAQRRMIAITDQRAPR